ncbi:hypothetical protein [Aeromonas caviae]|uniref:hypothetical protein n=1 Tax=Aeromonas caviae TaxID=648 RepID=UPI00191F14AD|nr:hypothetical protein [Aeromonas caviae]MBL0650311.1 hypothetical protein [Aeromonas caviae]
MHINPLNTLSYVVFMTLSLVVPIGVCVVISIFQQQNGLRDAPIDVVIGRLVVVSQVLSSHVMFSHNLFPNPSLQGCCQPGLSDEDSIFCSSQTGWEQKEYEKTTKRPSKEHGRKGGKAGKWGGDLHGTLGGRKPRFSLFSWGDEPLGPRAGEAGDIVGPPGWLYGASVMG